MTNFLGVYFPEFFYVLCGLVCFLTAFRARKNESARLGTMLFWALTGIIFMFGKVLPSAVVGAMLIAMGCLTVTFWMFLAPVSKLPVPEPYRYFPAAGMPLAVRSPAQT